MLYFRIDDLVQKQISNCESTRLKNWDYRNAGAYFITICTKERLHFFGEIKNGIMCLSNAGKLAEQYWSTIPDHFPNVQLGAFVVMPNHIHGILILTDVPVDTLQCNVSTTNDCNDPTNQCNVSNNDNDQKKPLRCNGSTEKPNEFMSNISPKSGSVSTIIRSFKSVCTKNINLKMPEFNFGWQSRFHDHIIRNHEEFVKIENYIINNPKNWKDDTFYSDIPLL